jgi:nucleotide-binding universal stress UspA family protein
MHGFIPTRILVPITAGPTAEESVRLGCRLAKRGKASVQVISILEVKRSLPLGSRDDEAMAAAEKLLDRAEEIGKELDVRVDTELLQAREAGPAIVEEVKAKGSDLVVIGLPYRQRYGEFYMGKTAPYVLSNAPCRCLILREPPPR